MEQDNNHNNSPSPSNNKSEKKGLNRREWLKNLSTVPILGAFAYAVYKKQQYNKFLRQNILEETQMSNETESSHTSSGTNGEKIRIGIIGYGIRGKQLLKAAGFAHPQEVEELKQSATNDPQDSRYQDFLAQEDLNIEINGVCDLFDIYAEKAREASANPGKEGINGSFKEKPPRYKRYTDLLAAKDIDAVIIATPDHWHARMIIDAAKAGKHVYVEKAMTRTVDEVYEVVQAVKNSDITFQLGHQGRQTESHIRAKEAIKKNVLGKVTLIEVTTNRNSPNGAWVYDIHPKASPNNIDWKQFIEPTREHPFSKERFFRWRCWWDYGTGLSGDLLSHEYDAMNQIMDLGIPRSAVASGGVYYFQDGRTVPDVFQTVYEYPERDLTMMYSATLASQKSRSKSIMGHDAWMDVENTLNIYPDPNSTKYKEKIDKGIIKPGLPIYSYVPGKKGVDAVTSATEQYFAGRGLLYTYRNGRRVDTTHLHIKEWLQAIRTGVKTSCNIDKGFEEAITSHMATIAYREDRKVFWDHEKQKII